MAMEKEIVFVEGLTELLTEVKRQGNNLNQLTRKLYSNGYIDYKMSYLRWKRSGKKYGNC